MAPRLKSFSGSCVSIPPYPPTFDNSSSDEVCTFALGLVLSSFDRDALIDVAKDIATEREASQFNSELDVLLQLVNQA